MGGIRKNLIAIIFILASALITLLFLNSNKSWKSNAALIFENQNASLQNAAPQKISKGAVDFFALSGHSADKIMFYDKSDSIVYESGASGKNKKELARIPNVSEMIFGPQGKEVVVALNEKAGPKKYYFDLNENSKIALDQNIESIAFSPDGTKLAYYFYDARLNEGGISISDMPGSGSKNIFKTRMKNLEVLWPDNDLIVFYPVNQDQTAFSISSEGGKFEKLSEEKLSSYLDKDRVAKKYLENLGIKFLKTELTPLDDYAIFVNAEDGKLYSLEL